MRATHQINQASWEVLAATHGQDDYYDTAALLAGESTFSEEEGRALQRALGDDVAGRDILHVQCHIGFDTISFARRGALVCGVDFSAAALEKASGLAQRAGVNIHWVKADVCDLPEQLRGRFDLAWATSGILCWISDLPAWMRSVASTLKPSGQLVLIDGHPLAKMVWSTNPLRLSGAYGGGQPQYIAQGCDYASSTKTGPQVQYAYSLGEMVSEATRAGLRVLELTEHMDLSYDLRAAGQVSAQDGRVA
jgi:SAM-dependent methyltransferase